MTLLPFNERKVQQVDLSDLRASYHENDIYGKPLLGIYHYELLNTLLAMCDAFGYDGEIEEIFVAQNRERNCPGVVLLPQVEDVYGERAIQAHVFRRVYANLRLRNRDEVACLANDEMSVCLAVAFVQRGIQVGMGTNVYMCHNQQMLNPTLFASTFGENRVSGVQQLIDTIHMWFEGAEATFKYHCKAVDRLRGLRLSERDLHECIGKLTALRVASDSSHAWLSGPTIYPLNQGQISNLTERILIRREQHGQLSAYDLYDCATTMMKATDMDMPSILPQNIAMVKFLAEQFDVKC